MLIAASAVGEEQLLLPPTLSLDRLGFGHYAPWGATVKRHFGQASAGGEELAEICRLDFQMVALRHDR